MSNDNDKINMSSSRELQLTLDAIHSSNIINVIHETDRHINLYRRLFNRLNSCNIDSNTYTVIKQLIHELNQTLMNVDNVLDDCEWILNSDKL